MAITSGSGSSHTVDNTISGNLSALNDKLVLDTQGCPHASIQITGTWSGTISFRGSIDGSTFFDISAFPITTSVGTQSSSASLGFEDTTTNGNFILNCHGFIYIEALAISWTSGSATIFMRSTVANGPEDVQAIVPADSAALDAFSRLRVATPQTLFSSKQIYDSQTLFWDDQQVSGTATSTYNTNQASTSLSVSGNVAGSRVRQTFKRFNYQPGKGQLITMTGVLLGEGGLGVTGVKRNLGYFDGYNGLFFQMDGYTAGVVVRSFTSGSTNDNVITQNNWNLDRLDGTGGSNNSSGIKLDFTKAQIFVIDFQWLGVGRVRFGFNINGRVFYCHQVLNANINSIVYMSSPNLPLRYDITSLGTGNATSAKIISMCSSVDVEGGYEDIGYQLSVDDGYTGIAANADTNIYSLLCLQLQSGKTAASIIPQFLSVMTPTNNTGFRYMVYLNPTIASSLSYTPINGSTLQLAIPTASNTITSGSGHKLFSGYEMSSKTSGTSLPLSGELSLGTNIAGVSDTLVIAVQTAPTSGATFFASFCWREVI